MNIKLPSPLTSISLSVLLAANCFLVVAPVARAADTEASKPIIDLGMVVKDADRTARFLTNVIGFKEVRGFPVNSDLGKKIG